MSEKQQEYLKKFYNLLRDNLLRGKRIREKSVLITLLETRSAMRYKILNNSTITSSLIPEDALVALLAKKEIQIQGDINSYAITAKGVWDYERSLGIINEDSFLYYLNEKYFKNETSLSKVKTELDEREATIIFAMIAARTFSEKSAVNLKKSDDVKEKWKEILERSFELLQRVGVIRRLEKKDFFERKGNEHVVSSIFRHNNYAVQKTHGIYAYKGNYEYFLDLYRDSTLSQEKLSYLFWKIFKGALSGDSISLIVDFCKEISSKESIFLFNIEEHIFSMPTFDSVIKTSLLDSVISKGKWSMVL
ncbi:MAG: hypothetical protein QW279_09740 [Candidatus Jordarchaeaceae archaeon]